MNIKEIINQAKTRVADADLAERYYNGEHDILKNRIVYINDKGQIVEDKYSSNIRIPHPFFRELVQQSTTNILFEDIKFKTDDDLLKEYLKEYITSDTHEVISEALEESSKKGWEWIYAYKQDNGLPGFQVIDGRQVVAIEDEYGNVKGVLRFYDEIAYLFDNEIKEIKIKGAKETKYVKMKHTYERNDKGEYVQTSSVTHTEYNEDGSIKQGYGLPWYELKNNRQRESDLKGIKEFIDDYDIMASYSSNDLQDFRGNVYVLKGAQGQDLSRLKFNTSKLGVVSTGPNQDVKVESHHISIDSRLKKMEIDRQNIFSIGQGFDTTTTFHNQGTVTNVQLRLGQQKLIQKCSGKIKYLNGLLNWMLDIVLNDIRRKTGERYLSRDIEIEYTHNILDDAKDSAETENTLANALLTKLNALNEASVWLSEDTIVEQVAILFGLDPEEEKRKRNEMGYETLLVDDLADLIEEESEEPTEVM